MDERREGEREEKETGMKGGKGKNIEGKECRVRGIREIEIKGG